MRSWIGVSALVLAGAPQESSERDARAPALRAVFDGLAEQGFSGAVLVAEGGEVLLRAAAGLADRVHGRLNQADTIFDVGSLTKQFTAAAILKLEEQGKLSVEDGLERFFEDVPRDKRAIRLRHLLTHTSGLPPDVPVGAWTGERAALLEACWQAKLTDKAGERYVYNNAGYELLAAVVEVAAGEAFEGFVERELFRPAGLGSTGFLGGSGVDVGRTARGYEGRIGYGPAEKGWYSWGLRGAGGVLSTVDDLWTWARALETDAVLSARSREKLATEHVAGYGFGWMVRQDAAHGKVVEHGGTTRGFEGWLARWLDEELVIVVLCNGRGMREAMQRGLAEVALGKAAAPAGAAPPALALSAAALQAFAGRYTCENGGTLAVSVAGAGLLLEPDLEAVLGLEFRTKGTKLEANRALAKRADELIELLSAGDAEGLMAVLSDRWPGWNQQMVRAWRGWSEERGPLSESEVLGSHGERTLVRLEHERRTVFWSLRWEKDVLAGWSLQGGLPEGALFVALSDHEFEHRGLDDSGERWKLSFGLKGALSLVGPTWLNARRVR